MTITSNLMEEFMLFLEEEEKAAATIEKYMRDVKAFSLTVSDTEIDKKTVLRYKEYLVANYAPASVNSVLSSLNSFFDFCGCQAFKVKLLKIQRQIFQREEKELTKGEYIRLLDAAKSKKNQRLFYLMQTICSTY